ncbi:nitrile hydratase-like protein [Nostoc sp. NIES-4103]|nr:nitrile hydratase-like protein [Nostoc sp. NIES-4103]
MKTLLNVDLQTELTTRAAKDPQFAAQLLEDPKGTLSAFINMDLPSDLEVSIHQESGNNLHIVLPAFDSPQKTDADMDIADDEILAGCTWGANCQSSIG